MQLPFIKISYLSKLKGGASDCAVRLPPVPVALRCCPSVIILCRSRKSVRGFCRTRENEFTKGKTCLKNAKTGRFDADFAGLKIGNCIRKFVFCLNHPKKDLKFVKNTGNRPIDKSKKKRYNIYNPEPIREIRKGRGKPP